MSHFSYLKQLIHAHFIRFLAKYYDFYFIKSLTNNLVKSKIEFKSINITISFLNGFLKSDNHLLKVHDY